MNILSSIISELSSTAKTLKLLSDELVLPTLEGSIKETAGKLRLLLGPQVHFSIKPPDIDFWGAAAKPAAGNWTIYVGSIEGRRSNGVCYESPTLAQALNLVVADLAPNPDPITEVQRQLAIVADPPVPF